MFNLNLASVFIQVDFSSCMSIHMVRNDVRQGDKYKSAHLAKTRPKSKQSEGFLCLFNLNSCNEELLDLTLFQMFFSTIFCLLIGGEDVVSPSPWFMHIAFTKGNFCFYIEESMILAWDKGFHNECVI